MTRDRDIAAPDLVVPRPWILGIQGLTPDMPYMLVCPYRVYSATGSGYAVYLCTIPLYTHQCICLAPGTTSLEWVLQKGVIISSSARGHCSHEQLTAEDAVHEQQQILLPSTSMPGACIHRSIVSPTAIAGYSLGSNRLAGRLTAYCAGTSYRTC